MQFKEKIIELRSTIEKTLAPLIGDKCILADAPYYNNIGDILIWQGIEDFLRHNNKSLISVTNINTFLFPEISEDITILLMGGGNFGDLYRCFQDFRLKVIKKYSKNRIIMFPQSIWYEDISIIERDARIFSQHNDLYLCARDKWSYDFLSKYFNANSILLVPDMAFCIDDKILESYRRSGTGKKLFLKRLDKELSKSTPHITNAECDIFDWPSFEKKIYQIFFLQKLLSIRMKLKLSEKLHICIGKCIDIYANRYLKKSLVKLGCKFLAPYSLIMTTRLHALILSVLLYKDVKYIDNITSKLSAFSDTWLKDLNNIKPYEG